MRRQLRRAERLAGTSGNEDLAGYISNAADLIRNLASRLRSDSLAPKSQAQIAGLNGNLSLAQAECADAGHPTAFVTDR